VIACAVAFPAGSAQAAK